jgi:hypothetical protein
MNEHNTLSDWLSAHNLTKEELGRRVGCSGVHIGRIIKADPPVSQTLALKIFDVTGIRIGPLAGISESEIAVVRRLSGAPAA